MERLTKFLNSVNEAIEQQQAQQMGRPTSLREAGRVGETAEGRPTRRPVRAEEATETGREPTAEERTSRRGRMETPVGLPTRRVDAVPDFGSEQTSEERTERRRRPAAVIASQRMPTTAAQIRTALRNPASFRTVVLIREVLDAPVSRRPRNR